MDREQLRRDLGLHGVTFVYVGRLWRDKGVGDLIDAYAKTRSASSAETSLLLVGDGPDEASLRARCAAEGVSDVVFAGFHQQEELAPYYAAADVFVFPTLGDPYGLVVDEAMACGLPVVSSTAAGELRRRVTDGVTGFITGPGDPVGWQRAWSIWPRIRTCDGSWVPVQRDGWRGRRRMHGRGSSSTWSSRSRRLTGASPHRLPLSGLRRPAEPGVELEAPLRAAGIETTAVVPPDGLESAGGWRPPASASWCSPCIA